MKYKVKWIKHSDSEIWPTIRLKYFWKIVNHGKKLELIQCDTLKNNAERSFGYVPNTKKNSGELKKRVTRWLKRQVDLVCRKG